MRVTVLAFSHKNNVEWSKGTGSALVLARFEVSDSYMTEDQMPANLPIFATGLWTFETRRWMAIERSDNVV